MAAPRNSARFAFVGIDDEGETVMANLNFQCHPLTQINIPLRFSESMARITANGLLLLYLELAYSKMPLYICNPLSRQYIELCCPEEYVSHKFLLSYGFGVSKISGQYKVVCINRSDWSNSGHHVYTLGTRTWRRLQGGTASCRKFCLGGHILCNGNLHWMTVYDSTQICGFDLETECFSFFCAPPPPVGIGVEELNVLKGCLCISYKRNDETVIWLMKEDQVDKSWTIVCTLSTLYVDWDSYIDWNMPVKRLIYCSNKTRNNRECGLFKDAAASVYYIAYATISTPSLFSLRSFGFQNVMHF